MAKLPNAENAIIDRRKITDYLLCETHELGAPKAQFFTSFGWSSDKPEKLIAALHLHANEFEIDSAYSAPFGEKFEITGVIQAPDGRIALIKSVWIILHDEETPRFVTALPA